VLSWLSKPLLFQAWQPAFWAFRCRTARPFRKLVMPAGGEASPKFPTQALPLTPSTGTVSNCKVLICEDFAAGTGRPTPLGSVVENPGRSPP
jgi:hypothetical protein